MKDASLDLEFPSLPYGTLGGSWGIGALLYRGGARVGRAAARKKIDAGEMRGYEARRLPLLRRIHINLSACIVRGNERSHRTVKSIINVLFSFVKWVDANDLAFSLQTAESCFSAWTEHLVHRFQTKKDLSHVTAYRCSAMIKPWQETGLYGGTLQGYR
ncbi:MAG: hypothetical protein WBW32_09490 [Luteibacter sp.]